MFKPHYYLDLPLPVAAEYFIGTVGGEPVAHLAVCPRFNTGGYRATRLVVMPEWQGAGVGTKFLNWVCSYHKQGCGRCGKRLGTFFHTSHPQLVQFLKRSKEWRQVSAVMHGAIRAKSVASLKRSQLKTGDRTGDGAGYGGHFRAVQGFKYIGP
jgi:GNAT superfamily N-acetyltransferase